ncbi:MAG TPA: sulfatase-like hydrolase/transferase [Candidatus Aminicenantes bacterium]|nr:sulfatase-like hydrolase/transferase [Candidatus Aminicenantes bacterium]HRY64562.1 sulfatase-like hydrolase/transferase [Candidatus Aminicenantes bacterium]HRZ71475.1 sulfatase-like hydrolase/transferase [Candidatus Aminicenantes bacterium]
MSRPGSRGPARPALAAGLALAAFLQLAAAPARPNLLLVTVDTLRPDRLGCYGSSHLQTPAIDRLAASGVLFARAFAHAPLTLPSHASILLGTTPLSHGVHDNGNFRVPDGLPGLAGHLKDRGYATGAFIGAFPLDARFGLDRGFDVYDQSYGSGTGLDFQFVERRAEAVVAAALAWLEGRAGPWFAWIHVFDPHQPYAPPAPFADRHKDDPYSGEVAYVDASLAGLFAFLDDSRQAASTVVVLTGDHGQSLGEHGETTHGYFAYNATLWVPLIIAGPGVRPGRVEANVCHIDIFPTVCDLLGLPRPSFLQGLSLRPAMQGREAAALAARPIYFESLYAYYRRGWAPLRGFIEGRRKFIDLPLPEVYDIGEDFAEARNLAGPDAAAERARLARLVAAGAGTEAAAKPQLGAAAREKLQSLGYVGGYRPPAKVDFGPEDDLKTLLPFNRKFEQAQDLYFRGQVEPSISLLRELVRDRPDFDNPYLFLVTVYEKAGRLAEAEAILKKGAAANPRNYKLAIERGIVLAEMGRNDEAVAVLDRAAAIIDWDPELWNYLGVAYWNKGDLDRAMEAYERALALDPRYAAVLSNLGTAQAALSMRTKDAALLRRAMDSFKRALEADPRDASAYNGLGAAYRLLGDVEAAISCFEQALALEPGHMQALYNLGTACLDKGDKAGALARLAEYKERYGKTLPDKDKAALDALMERCR